MTLLEKENYEKVGFAFEKANKKYTESMFNEVTESELEDNSSSIITDDEFYELLTS